MAEPLLIADIPWLLYRSYFALPRSIADADGHPVNALLGTVNALLAALQARPARAVVAALGAEQADYRVRLYPPYHAHRDPMPADLARQWGLAPRLLASLGWTVGSSEDLEADDVMLSHARTEEEHGGSALLLTADRDLFGAVTARVAVLEVKKGEEPVTVGPEEVERRYDVRPDQVADFIALRGDPSDGLPGAPGIGAKTAATLLREHESLERLLRTAAEDTGSLRPRVAAVLREHADQLLVFKQVATLQRIDVVRPADAATDFAAGSLTAGELGMARLAARLDELSGV
jgi:DNA polymerase-1